MPVNKPALEKPKAINFGTASTVNAVGNTVSEKNKQNNNTSGMNPNTTEFDRIANIPADARATAVEKQKETNAMYNNKQQQEDLDTHTGRQSQIVNDFAMTPEQWYKMYGYWDWNLAKDNPNGNLNNRTYGQTLSASRLADALNNKRHWRAAKIGRRTNSSFGTNEYTPGYSERWEPIETQETRQMRANEAMDLAARQRQVNRAENIQDYPLELQKMADRTRSELAKYASQTGIDLQRAMQASKWQAEYGKSWDTYWTNFVTKFSRELDLDIRDRVMQKIANLQYPFSQIYASLSGGMAPNPIVTTAWQYIQSVADDISDPKTKATFMTAAMALLTGVLGSQTMGVFNNVF